MNERSPKGWYYRGGLPHYDAPGFLQAITFRLGDSLPAEAIEKIKATRKDRRSRVLEAALDAGFGRCILREPVAAAIVARALRHFHGQRYRLGAWVIMPNHVHVLVQPFDGVCLPDVVQSWKSFSAKEINTRLGMQGRLWQANYFDRFVRDDRHHTQVATYIENNPVKAGLVEAPDQWPFGSAAARRLEEANDGDT